MTYEINDTCCTILFSFKFAEGLTQISFTRVQYTNTKPDSNSEDAVQLALALFQVCEGKGLSLTPTLKENILKTMENPL